MQTHHPKTERRKIVDQFRRSGVTYAEFAAGLGVHRATLLHWAREFYPEDYPKKRNRVQQRRCGFSRYVPDEDRDLKRTARMIARGHDRFFSSRGIPIRTFSGRS